MTQVDIAPAVAAPKLEPPEAAYVEILPEINALSDDEATSVNLDPVAAAGTVLGLLPELRLLRPRIVKELPMLDIEQFDKLELYALAFSHTNGVFRTARVPKGQIAALANELSVIRDRLIGDAMSLANNGFFSASRLDQCKKVPGYKALAGDILAIVPLFKEHWPKIANRTPVTLDSLGDASRRAVELMSVVGLKEQGPELLTEAALRRGKAFTLFLRAYEEARHAVTYLRRHEGDAASITPSLYAGRGGRRPQAESGDDEATPAEGAALEDVSDATAALEPPQASPAAKVIEAPPQIQINNPKNLPIDSPFTSN